jgi:hypothetical protein
MQINKKSIRVLRVIFCFLFLVIITVPAIRTNYTNHSVTSLYGVAPAGNEPNFSLGTYWNGNFQGSYEDWYNKGFGWHDRALKQYNQYLYDFFHMSDSNITITTDNTLISKDYIDEYYSLLDIELSDEQLNALAERLLQIQTDLEKQGKHFLFVLSPTKMDFYNGKMPYYIEMAPSYSKGLERNGIRLRKLLMQKGVNYIDCKQILQDYQKATGLSPYTKTGIHWTYGATITVLQEIIKIMNNDFGYNVRTIDIEGYYAQTEAKNNDKDLYDLLNIYQGTTDEYYYYPNCKVDSQNSYDEPDIFMHGCSFSLMLDSALKNNMISNNIDLITYMQVVLHSPYGSQSDDITSFNDEAVSKALSGKDIYLLEFNEALLSSYAPVAYSSQPNENDFTAFFGDYLNKDLLSDQKYYSSELHNVNYATNYVTAAIHNPAVKYLGISIYANYSFNPEDGDQGPVQVYINDKNVWEQTIQSRGYMVVNITPEQIPDTTDDIYHVRIVMPQKSVTGFIEDNLNDPTFSLEYLGQSRS